MYAGLFRRMELEIRSIWHWISVFKGKTAGIFLGKHGQNIWVTKSLCGGLERGTWIPCVRLESTLWKLKIYDMKLLKVIHNMLLTNPIILGFFVVYFFRVQKGMTELKWSSFLPWRRNKCFESHYASPFYQTSMVFLTWCGTCPIESHYTITHLNNFSRLKRKSNIEN